jgi:sulfonate transport system permease protein
MGRFQNDTTRPESRLSQYLWIALMEFSRLALLKFPLLSEKETLVRLAFRFEGLLLPLALLLVWQWVVAAGYISANLMPPPTQIAQTLGQLVGDGSLAVHVGVSSARVLIGFVIGASLGVAVGAVVGLNRTAQALFDPGFQALRAIPSLAWVPLLLLWAGIDEGPKLSLIAIGAFFPIYLSVVSGFHNVDRKFLEVGAIYGLSGSATVWRILIPAALPSLLTGLRNGLSLSWMFMVAAELIAATRGLGFLLNDGRDTGRADLIIVGIITIAVLGKFSDSLLRTLEHQLLEWRDVFQAR